MLTVPSKGQCGVKFIDFAYGINTGAKSLAAFMQTFFRVYHPRRFQIGLIFQRDQNRSLRRYGNSRGVS